MREEQRVSKRANDGHYVMKEIDPGEIKTS